MVRQLNQLLIKWLIQHVEKVFYNCIAMLLFLRDL